MGNHRHQRRMLVVMTWTVVLATVTACAGPAPRVAHRSSTLDSVGIRSEVEAAVWSFHAADTTRDAEAVVRLLWPEYSMLVDGARIRYEDAATGSRAFMASLEVFHTEWTDLEVTPLGPDAAVASFQFRDSIVTKSGELIRARGPTTFVWQRRGDEWKLLFGDADHYPVER